MPSELDPKDWNAFRAVAHQALDDAITYMQTVGDRPVWRTVPEDVKKALREPLPETGQPLEQVYSQFKELVLPYPNGNIHPRFWGWVMGTGSPTAMLAEMLGGAMNAHLAGYDQSPSIVEEQTLEWLKQMLGYPMEATGVLVSGCTTANLIGLAVARHAADPEIRASGLGGRQMTVYGSTETHSWAAKACELMGLGKAALRLVPVDSDFRIKLDDLAAQVAADRAAGMQPFCVIGNAGTVNTAATDDLNALADFCEREDLWFHVDGAFGALAALVPKLRPQVAGMERADSLAFDLHKWGYLPYEIACIFVRDSAVHRSTFATKAHYLNAIAGGVAREPLVFPDLGIQLSRGFRALKLWMALKNQGVDAWARAIERNVDDCQYLAARITATPELELLAPVPLNIVCFRYRAPEAEANALNQAILVRLQEDGIALPSSTVIDGKFAIRVANTNHRTSREDFDVLVEAVVRLGSSLLVPAQ
ncbi:MAG: amino acid decarboxylase [Armatimonadetes bacterium]|nr:amino acid decarboxylase [Armatimonadota bacterium]